MYVTIQYAIGGGEYTSLFDIFGVSDYVITAAHFADVMV